MYQNIVLNVFGLSMGIGIIPDSDVGKVIDIIDGFSFNAVMLAPTEGTKRYVR
jgi:hypothetical protein